MNSKILFVDDEPRKIDSFVSELQLSGYEVIVKKDVDSAFEYLSENINGIELIILDILMSSGKITQNMDTEDGVKTGLRFLEKIREKFDTSTPILIFTNLHISDDIKTEIQEDLKANILYKEDYLPFELAESIEDFLTSQQNCNV
jgi:CheY-like chemotaxis protein